MRLRLRHHLGRLARWAAVLARTVLRRRGRRSRGATATGVALWLAPVLLLSGWTRRQAACDEWLYPLLSRAAAALPLDPSYTRGLAVLVGFLAFISWVRYAPRYHEAVLLAVSSYFQGRRSGSFGEIRAVLAVPVFGLLLLTDGGEQGLTPWYLGGLAWGLVYLLVGIDPELAHRYVLRLSQKIDGTGPMVEDD